MFVHEALLYGSDEDFLATAVPFIDAGATREETTVLAVDPRLSALVLDGLHEPAAVEVVDGGYESPLTTLRLNHDLFAATPQPIRIVGQIPDDGVRDGWRGWARYEAVANDFFAPFPVSALCAYDTRTTPDIVLEDVVLTHPGVAGPFGHRPNPEYLEPPAFLAGLSEGEVDPLESTAPRFVLHDPMPEDARRAVVALARAAGLDDNDRERMGLATSEVVKN